MLRKPSAPSKGTVTLILDRAGRSTNSHTLWPTPSFYFFRFVPCFFRVFRGLMFYIYFWFIDYPLMIKLGIEFLPKTQAVIS